MTQDRTNVVGRVNDVLKSRHLSLRQVSERSSSRYGRSSPYFVPHNFYSLLRRSSYSPRLQQLCALSGITGYWLGDWLKVFGFDPGKIVELQLRLPPRRTVLLDPFLADEEAAPTSWFRDLAGRDLAPGIIPLGSLLHLCKAVPQNEDDSPLYVRIGAEDAFVFPELAPGSIVRVHPYSVPDTLTSDSLTGKIFLIEHNRGLWCTRLRAIDQTHVAPVCSRLPFAEIILNIPAQARILGVVDLEIRNIIDIVRAEVPKDLAGHSKPVLFIPHKSLKDLLRSARQRAALSLREVSALSGRIAGSMKDARYFIAHGTLSDYEAQELPPRHFHKVISLCAIYGIPFQTFLRAVGIERDVLRKDRMPRELIDETQTPEELLRDCGTASLNPNLQHLQSRFGHVPFFLRHALNTFSGMKHISLRNFFWIEGETLGDDPRLRSCSLILVDRKKKKPRWERSLLLTKQPMYMLLLRDGTYLCTSCSLEDGVLSLPSGRTPAHLRNQVDAEVIGQAAAIARRLS